MVGTITVVSQEAAQVLDSAGEGPLGKNILAYFIEFSKALFPLVLSGCDLRVADASACDASGIYAYTTSRTDFNFLLVLSKKDRCIFWVRRNMCLDV